MHRPLACSFKRSYSLVKSREELVAENENAKETQEKEQVETENQENNNTENETQSVEASECSSLTEEDQVVTEEKVALDVQLAIARSVWTLLLSSCLYSIFHVLQGYILDYICFQG